MHLQLFQRCGHKKQVSMTKKCHNHRLQTNPQHNEEGTQMQIAAIQLSKQSARSPFLSKKIAKLKRPPRSILPNKDPSQKNYTSLMKIKQWTWKRIVSTVHNTHSTTHLKHIYLHPHLKFVGVSISAPG